MFCLQAGAQPRVLVFTLLGDEGLLCDFRAAFLDFWAVDAYAPSKAAFKPHRCGHWSRQHGITCAQSSQQAGGTWLWFLYCKSVNWDPGGSEVKGTQWDLCESKKRVQQAKVTDTSNFQRLLTGTLGWAEEEGGSSSWAAPTFRPKARKYTYAESKQDGGKREELFPSDTATFCWEAEPEGDWRKPKDSRKTSVVRESDTESAHSIRTVGPTPRLLPSKVRTMAGLCLLGGSQQLAETSQCCFCFVSLMAPRSIQDSL